MATRFHNQLPAAGSWRVQPAAKQGQGNETVRADHSSLDDTNQSAQKRIKSERVPPNTTVFYPAYT
jgi:hypothetical protein